jgi:hypothetical protein
MGLLLIVLAVLVKSCCSGGRSDETRHLSQIPEMTAEQLHRALVEDLVNGVHTDPLDGPPILFVSAIRKIAAAQHRDMEAVYIDIREEAQARGSHPTMHSF